MALVAYLGRQLAVVSSARALQCSLQPILNRFDSRHAESPPPATSL